jgi:hypothetical protein
MLLSNARLEISDMDRNSREKCDMLLGLHLDALFDAHRLIFSLPAACMFFIASSQQKSKHATSPSLPIPESRNPE